MLKNIMRVTDTELHTHYTVRELIHTHTMLLESYILSTVIVLLPVVTVELHFIVVCLASMMNNCFNTWSADHSSSNTKIDH